MLEYFSRAKRSIADTIRTQMETRGTAYAVAARFMGPDAAARLAEFSVRGKMLRGCLVRLGYELTAGREATGEDERALALAGAAMELFQSGLLVHDDIMDRDRVRRGFPTLHVGYETALAQGGYDDPPHYGEALGICSGDLAYFAAFQMLTELPVAPERALAAARVAARELCLVGVAQMQDVANGAARRDSRDPFRPEGEPSGASPAAGAYEPDEESILRLYRYKTGRYTFSLPLALGAALAGAPTEKSAAIEAAGEELGVLFQLKDDELGLFASAEELGKPIGADIREDKKTVLRLRLFARAHEAAQTGDDTLAQLSGIFGRHDAEEAEIGYVRAAAERLGVRAELEREMEAYARRALELALPLTARAPAEAARAFRELVAYSRERRS